VARIALYPDPLLAQVLTRFDLLERDSRGLQSGRISTATLKRRCLGPGHSGRPLCSGEPRASLGLTCLFPSVLDMDGPRRTQHGPEQLGNAVLNAGSGIVMDAVAADATAGKELRLLDHEWVTST